MNTANRIVDALERSEAEGATQEDLLELLQEADSAELLWQVADSVVAYPNIMGALYRRALQLGAAEARALGYLALSHMMNGDVATARSIIGKAPQESHDDVALTAWAVLTHNDSDTVARLQHALTLFPESLRLWRQLAAATLRTGALAESRRAHEWLLQHEPFAVERARVDHVMKRHGWR